MPLLSYHLASPLLSLIEVGQAPEAAPEICVYSALLLWVSFIIVHAWWQEKLIAFNGFILRSAMRNTYVGRVSNYIKLYCIVLKIHETRLRLLRPLILFLPADVESPGLSAEICFQF